EAGEDGETRGLPLERPWVGGGAEGPCPPAAAEPPAGGRRGAAPPRAAGPREWRAAAAGGAPDAARRAVRDAPGGGGAQRRRGGPEGRGVAALGDDPIVAREPKCGRARRLLGGREQDVDAPEQPLALRARGGIREPLRREERRDGQALGLPQREIGEAGQRRL